MFHKVHYTAIILFFKLLLDNCSDIKFFILFGNVGHAICKWAEVQMRGIIVIFVLSSFNWMVAELWFCKCLIFVNHFLAPTCHYFLVMLYGFGTWKAFWPWFELWNVTFPRIEPVCASMAKLVWTRSILQDIAGDGKGTVLVVYVLSLFAELGINHLESLIKSCCWLFGPTASFFKHLHMGLKWISRILNVKSPWILGFTHFYTIVGELLLIDFLHCSFDAGC